MQEVEKHKVNIAANRPTISQQLLAICDKTIVNIYILVVAIAMIKNAAIVVGAGAAGGCVGAIQHFPIVIKSCGGGQRWPITQSGGGHAGGGVGRSVRLSLFNHLFQLKMRDSTDLIRWVTFLLFLYKFFQQSLFSYFLCEKKICFLSKQLKYIMCRVRCHGSF